MLVIIHVVGQKEIVSKKETLWWDNTKETLI